MLRCRIARGRRLILLSCREKPSVTQAIGCEERRALTQGCEDGGDVWLSHVGANEIVAGRMCLMEHVLLPMRGLVVAVVQICARGQNKVERNKKEEAGRGRKWQARLTLLRILQGGFERPVHSLQ
jgi:hypothetical protein